MEQALTLRRCDPRATAVNASTSTHSSVNFTPFGNDALTLAGEKKGAALLGSDPRTSSQAAGKSITAMLLCRGRHRSAALSI